MKGGGRLELNNIVFFFFFWCVKETREDLVRRQTGLRCINYVGGNFQEALSEDLVRSKRFISSAFRYTYITWYSCRMNKS